MIQLDLKSRTPIFKQIVENFKHLIINDVLKGDEKIPSVRELSKMITINPNTIQKAYKELERQGYIYTIQGRGNFVASKAPKIDRGKIGKIMENTKKQLAELIYLGIKKEELIELIESVYEEVQGGTNHD